MRGILTYHSVDPSGSAISIDEAAFRRHVAWLASGRVRVTTLTELLERPAAEDAVALTFDDGFANFAAVAWPLLRERGVPVTVYIVSDRVGGTNAWGGRDAPGIPTMPLLGWDALGSLVAEGVTLGAHSRTHPDLRRLGRTALEDEVAGSAERIAAETGQRPEAFAYPYGRVSGAAVAVAARVYRLACTTEHRALTTREDPLRLPRLDCWYFRRGGLEAWGTAAFRARVRVRRGLRRLQELATEGVA